jgi:CheY-like chemotaxis protein
VASEDLARGGVRILVVDDDLSLTATFAKVLTSEGHDVMVANDGAEALAQVRESCPSAVIVDLHMPVMDGVEFLDGLRALPECADVPVILMSGSGDMGTVRRHIESKGVVLLMAKPPDIDTLLTAVSRLVEGF